MRNQQPVSNVFVVGASVRCGNVVDMVVVRGLALRHLRISKAPEKHLCRMAKRAMYSATQMLAMWERAWGMSFTCSWGSPTTASGGSVSAS